MPNARIPIRKLLESISPQETQGLRLPAEGELELSYVKDGIWILTNTSPLQNGASSISPTSPIASVPAGDFVLQPIHLKILRLMKTHGPGDLVEGKFEQFLSSEEQRAFKELLLNKKVEAFRSSPKYNLGIYREVRLSATPAPAAPARAIPTIISEKPVEEYRLDTDGFEILRNEGAAKQRSYELADRMKSNEVKGLKTFDGFYYLIVAAQLEAQMPLVMQAMKGLKKAELKEIAATSKLPPVLAKIILEFAKEEGSIIEKRKDSFAYVG
ncbi:MAG: hypothetical protein IPJ89_04445 [Candidatus Iainarchaeum archaeon]|uniref:Uncharacterized protein n=1 Tax=Candidatus Iainarchaeum sp. TaxID=3101447 RepID=A0A7T9I1I3_9ARCH|nr:MAG: hypothetical protein IPJ89_04445 [Candidatus Diapherotrites archaeon]